MRIPNEALRQTATIEDFDGSGSRGATFGPARTVKASAQQIASFTVEWKDEEVQITTLILIRPEAGPVAPGSKVTLDGVPYRVVKSFPIPDAFRPSHYELAVRSWGYE